jgi:thiopurine S-methyltransferase
VYLAKFGIETIGVEGIAKACEEFMAENPELRMSKSSKPLKTFDEYSGKSITLLKGDFFELPTVATNKFDAVWDRASIVAIDPSMRTKYVQVMGDVIKPGGRILASTLWRKAGTPEGVARGPPFSVSNENIQELYGSQPWVESIEQLDEIDIMLGPGAPRWRAQGVTEFRELVFLIKVKKEASEVNVLK